VYPVYQAFHVQADDFDNHSSYRHCHRKGNCARKVNKEVNEQPSPNASDRDIDNHSHYQRCHRKGDCSKKVNREFKEHPSASTPNEVAGERDPAKESNEKLFIYRKYYAPGLYQTFYVVANETDVKGNPQRNCQSNCATRDTGAKPEYSNGPEKKTNECSDQKEATGTEQEKIQSTATSNEHAPAHKLQDSSSFGRAAEAASEEPLLLPMEEYLASVASSDSFSQISDGEQVSDDFSTSLKHDADKVTVTLRCPLGVSKEDLHVELDSNLNALEFNVQNSGYSQLVSLPEGIKPGQISAKFRKNKLIVTVPIVSSTIRID